MGFLTPDPVKLPHYCTYPSRACDHASGTRWQCDGCLKIYRVEDVFDRNILAAEWVLQK